MKLTKKTAPSRITPAKRTTKKPRQAKAIAQQLHVHNRVHRPLISQGLTYGVAWPQGAVADVQRLALLDETGRPVPAAFTVLNAWPDGSVQWSLLDSSLDFPPSGNRALTIRAAGKAPAATAPDHPVHISCAGSTAVIGNGLVEIAVSGLAGQWLSSWTCGGKALLVGNAADITFRSAEGKLFSLRAGEKTLSIEHANPLRAVLRIDGKHAAVEGQEQLLDYFVRLEVRSGRRDVKLTYSFRNRELPTPGIEISDLKAVFPTTVGPQAQRCFTANNVTRHYLTRCLRISEDPEIVASDTGDIDNFPKAHVPKTRADCFVRDATVLHDPPENKPWYLQDPKFRLQAGGNKCVWPYLGLVDEQGGVLGSFAAMTSLYPKSLRPVGGSLEFGIWPAWAGPLAITQGAGRSHSLHLTALPAGVSDQDLQNHYLSWEMGGLHTHVPSSSTLDITPDIAHVRRCKVFAIDKLPAFAPGKRFSFERKVLDSWIGVSYGQLGAVDQVQPWPAAGLWDYGDNGRGNNEEMHSLVYLQNHLRCGNWACAEYGLTGATHMMEVDHCAFSVDHFQNGGMVAHCMNHNDGAAYPSHMWFTELLFAYVLTGDREYKAAALRSCENLLHWINSDEGFAIIRADQREAGQPMINLTWCYHFQPEQRYLDACWKIVRQYLMAAAKEHGRMLDEKPIGMPVKVCSYGDYASWEGMFWLWEITGDKELKGFMLEQLEWRLTPEFCGVHGGHRGTDYNPAAYAFYLTGQRKYLQRVAGPFRAAFRAARWPIGWVHSMYYLHLAFEQGIVKDEDVLVQ